MLLYFSQLGKLSVSTMKMNCSQPSTRLPKSLEMLLKKIHISFCECYEGCAVFLPLACLTPSFGEPYWRKHPSQSWPCYGSKNVLPTCSVCTEASSGFGKRQAGDSEKIWGPIKCFSEINVYFDENNHIATSAGIFCLNESRSPWIGLPNSVMSHCSIFTMLYQILHKCNKITWKGKGFFPDFFRSLTYCLLCDYSKSSRKGCVCNCLLKIPGKTVYIKRQEYNFVWAFKNGIILPIIDNSYWWPF